MKIPYPLAIAVGLVGCSGTTPGEPPDSPALKLSFGPAGSQLFIMVGASVQLSARVVTAKGTVMEADGPITWTSRNPPVMLVDTNGFASALAAGSSVIVAEARVGSRTVRDSMVAQVSVLVGRSQRRSDDYLTGVAMVIASSKR